MLQVGAGLELREALQRVMGTGMYREYAFMTKYAYNDLIGQKRLWVAGEREKLCHVLCHRVRFPRHLLRAHRK